METEDDKGLLEDALSDTPAETTPEPAPAEPAVEAGQPRDEHGRFAPKEEAAPVVAPQAEQGAPVTPRPDAQDHRVPLRELLDEREKRQNYERDLAQYRAQVEHLSRLIGQQQQPQAKEPQPAPDFFQDPDKYFDHRVEPIYRQVEQELRELKLQRELDNKESAVEKFGAETVQTAYQTLVQQMQAGQAQHEYQKIMSSARPYHALVAWHQRETNLAKVGNDPNAWLEAELEKRTKDPAFVAKLIEQHQGQLNGSSGRPASVQLPPSLSRTPASMGSTDDDGIYEDDAAALKSALRR